MTRIPVLRWIAQVLVIAALGVGSWCWGAWMRHRIIPRTVPVLTVSFLDVTDGDCAVIRTPDDRFILIDAGGANCRDEVVDSLRKMGAQQIDLLVLASADNSGLGGVPALLHSGLPIRSVWNSNITSGATDRAQIMAEVQARRIPTRIVHAGEQAKIGSSPMQISVVWPPQHGERAHEDALVCRIDYGAQSGIFLGPLTEPAEPYIISGAADQLRADVLQVTDHGAGDSASLELLRRVQPEIAVISATSQASPAPAAVQRLQAAGADIWQTDTQGTVTVTLQLTANTPAVTGSQL